MLVMKNYKEIYISEIYKSYLKASKYINYNSPDSEKRNPLYTKDIIKQLSYCPSILVTGSKGKGSVATMIFEILQLQYSVGLMTSPHLIDFDERFKVNGKNILDSDFVDCMQKIIPKINPLD